MIGKEYNSSNSFTATAPNATSTLNVTGNLSMTPATSAIAVPTPSDILNIKGEYIQVEFPSKFIATSYQYASRYNLSVRTPVSLVLAGSNDNNIFTIIDARSSLTFTDGTVQTFSLPNNTTSYSIYRFIFTKINAGYSGYFDISQLNFFNGGNMYPPVKLSSNTLSGQPYGNGSYNITSSSTIGASYNPYGALGNTTIDTAPGKQTDFISITPPNNYDSNGLYTGNVASSITYPIGKAIICSINDPIGNGSGAVYGYGRNNILNHHSVWPSVVAADPSALEGQNILSNINCAGLIAGADVLTGNDSSPAAQLSCPNGKTVAGGTVIYGTQPNKIQIYNVPAGTSSLSVNPSLFGSDINPGVVKSWDILYNCQ
jgi:hypothetical protein